MKRMCGLAFLALGACVQATGDTSDVNYDQPRIELHSGGAFSGSYSTTVLADDTVVSQTSGPFGEGSTTDVTVIAGAYERAVAVLVSQGNAVAAGLRPEEEPCLDYGTDLVTATPAVGGFSDAGASCPNEAVLALLTAVNQAISGP